MKKKILITGSNGLLGQKLVDYITKQPDFELIATSLHTNKNPANDSYIFELMDITQTVEVQYICQRYQPDVIINAAGMTDVNRCEEDKSRAWRVNVEGVKILADVANQMDAHLIHGSTDFVFDGISGFYQENHIPNPVNYYGVTKWEGEKQLQAIAKKWSIVRTVLVYGVTQNMARQNIALWVKNSLEAQKTIHVVDDQFRTPTLAEDLAEACFTIANNEKEGIFHVAGSELVSVYEMAKKVARVFQLDESLIKPVSTISLNEKVKRPLRTGFSIEKARREIGFQPHTITNGLTLMKHQIETIQKTP